MNKRIVWWILSLVFMAFIILFSIEEVRTLLLVWTLHIFLFLKQNSLTLLAAFFLVKGKFVLTIFLKKIALLSATGLSKRYLIEKVINHNLKIHFWNHISDDIKRLVLYIKENFKDFPLIKQLMAGLAFLGSLSFVGKFMGSMLAMKVFVAKFWSFILAIVLKFSTAVIYFFTDYIWGSWIAPIVEVLIFSWLIEWMEKVPFLKQYTAKIYKFFILVFGRLTHYMEKLFHIPVKHFFKYLAKRIKKNIYAFIGYEKVSAWKRLREIRELSPNSHTALGFKRKDKRGEKQVKQYVSKYKRLLQQRKSKK